MNDRRTQIIQAARELVTTDGLSAVTVRGVAARVGIGASTLRHYFPTQAALYDAVIGEAFDAQLDDLRIADSSVPARERLHECMMQFLVPQQDQQLALEHWLAAMASMVGPDATSLQRHVWSVTVRGAARRVQQWLEILAAEGVLRDGDRERQRQLIMSAVDGIALGLLLPETGMTHERAGELIGDVIDVVLR